MSPGPRAQPAHDSGREAGPAGPARHALRRRLEAWLQALWQSRGPLSTLLLPLSWPVAAAARRRRARPAPPPAPVPVVVVGNLYVGGTGKTPVTEALVRALRARGWQPGIISRGYGIRAGAEPRVGLGRLDPARYGDEPALLAEATGAPVAVHPRRVLALAALLRAHPSVDVVIADDGLQHAALPRDLEIAVQDARGIGNGRLLPAGPLREPPERLATVDFLVCNQDPGGADPAPPPAGPRAVRMRLRPSHVEHLRSGERQDWLPWLQAQAGRSHGAVAAIGRPARFFAMLEQAGLPLQARLALADHHPRPASAFPGLRADCILITPKDAVKCREAPQDDRVWVVHAAPAFDPAGWLDEVHARLRARHPAGAAAPL